MDRRDELIQAGLVLASELSLSAVLQRIIELAAEITGARYGALGVVEEEADRIHHDRRHARAASSDRRSPRRARDPWRPHPSRDRPNARPDRRYHQGSSPSRLPPHHPEMRSFLGAPIVARGEVFGDIYLTEKLGAAQFSEEDEQSILVLASQAGVAIHNARLYEESRRRERWLDAVQDITNAVLSGTGSDQALALIASRARDLVAADLATVVIPDPWKRTGDPSRGR